MTRPAADDPSAPCNRIRRLLARLRERRNRVINKSKLGKTENCAGRRICTAVRRTSTEAVMLNASMMSSRKLGIGTSMTKTMLTAAAGTIQSIEDFLASFGLVRVAIIAFQSLPDASLVPGL